MSDIILSVGTQFYVSTQLPTTYDETGFGALAWTEVGEVENIGEFGGDATITEFIPLSSGIVKKRKGSINYGTASLAIGRLGGDTGQGILKDGFDGSNRYQVHSFKMVNSDGATAYFTGVVASFTTTVNDANTVMMVNCNVELDNRVLSDTYDFFTITYVAGANGSIIGTTVQQVPDGGSTTAVYAAPDGGYEFTSWSDASTDNPRTDTNVTATATFTATFSVI